MKAQRLHQTAPLETKPLRYEDVPVPKPGPGEVLIKVLYCGVCLTDKHIIENELPPHKLPLIPGHQVVGFIEDEGRHVGAYWLYSSCSVCDYCKKGFENLCEQATFTGFDRDGGYAEYMVARRDFLVDLDPDMVSEKMAPLLCAGIVGYRSYKLSGIRPGETLALVGFGTSAHLIIQLARYHRCTVYVFTRGEHHRRLARELGADFVGPLDAPPPRLVESVILFAPVGELIATSLKMLKRGGKLAVNAIHMSDLSHLAYEDLYYEKSVTSVSHVTRADAREFIDLARTASITPRTELFPLKRANDALIKQKESRHLGAIVLAMEG